MFCSLIRDLEDEWRVPSVDGVVASLDERWGLERLVGVVFDDVLETRLLLLDV